MQRKIFERRELAVAVLGGGENEPFADDDERNDFLTLGELDAANARGIAPHRANLGLVEANGFAAVRTQDDVVRTVGQPDTDQTIAVAQIHRDDARGARTRVRRQRRLLDRAVTRGHEHEVLVVELFDREHRVDLLALFERHQIHERLAACIAAGLRQLEHPKPIDAAAIRETQQRIVGMRDEELLDEILVLDGCGSLAATAAPLRLVLGERLALRVAGMGNRHDHVLRLDQILGGQIDVVAVDFSAPRIAVLFADGEQLGAHDLSEPLVACEDVREIDDLRQQGRVLTDDLVLFESRQPVQPHVEDGLRLHLAQPITAAIALQTDRRSQILRAGGHVVGAREHFGHSARGPRTLDECHLRLGRRRRALDESDNLVDVGECHRKAFEHVGPIARLGQIEHGAASDHLTPMAEEGLEHFLERQEARLPVDQGHHVDAEHGLERRLRVEVVEHDLGVLASTQLDDDAHAVLVGLVAKAVVGDPFDLLLAHQIGDALDQPCLVDLIRQLGDHDGLAITATHFLEMRARTDRQATASGLVGRDDFLGAVDDA